MNILQLISSKGFFGAENVLVQLAAELHKNSKYTPIAGVINNIATPHLEVIEACVEKGINTAIFPCQGKIDLKTIKTLRRYIQSNTINIVHSHGYKSNLYAYCATIGLPVKRVATCHNWLGDDLKMKFYAGLDKYFLKKFDSIVAVSDAVEASIEAAGVSRLKIKKINNGIAVSEFQNNQITADLKNDLGLPENSIVIGSVGRISEEKGHTYLLASASDIIKKYPYVYFLIVGDGDLKNKLEKEYKSSNIIFTGLRRDVSQLYQCMDIFILPSLNEGLPMVLLEAMASKKPVIATRVGNISSVIDHKKNGLLIDPGDSGSLAEAILYFLEDRERATALANNGYAKVINCFSSDAMAKEYAEIYKEIL